MKGGDTRARRLRIPIPGGGRPAGRGSDGGGNGAADGRFVSAAWHRPEAPAALLLAHGAGGSMDTPSIVEFARALDERGIGTVRFNFPYREAGRRAPDRAPALEACVRAALDQMREAGIKHLFAGGRSMGGRMASHAAAAGEEIAGLVFLAYPLHPPGAPDRLRDAHLGAIRAPMLFIQGTRDPFAQRDLLHATVDRLPSATLHTLEGGDHSLRVRGRPAGEVTAELAETTAAWMAQHLR